MSESSRSKMQWAELIATIGVLVSLVFVGLELRQNTAIARAQARSELAMLDQEFLMTLGQDSVANRAWRVYWYGDDLGELTAVEESQAFYLMIARIQRLEATYVHYLEGLIPEAALDTYGMRSDLFDGPHFRTDFWPGLRDNYDPEFVRFFESIHGL